jgi:hypothetical protein
MRSRTGIYAAGGLIAAVIVALFTRHLMISDAEQAQHLPPFLVRIDSLAKELQSGAAGGHQEPRIRQSRILAPYVMWELGAYVNDAISRSSGSVAYYAGFDNAEPLWTAKSVIFFKVITDDPDAESSHNAPGRPGTMQAMGWVVNIQTGKSTGFYLGQPATVIFTPDAPRGLPDSDRDPIKEFSDWVKSHTVNQ